MKFTSEVFLFLPPPLSSTTANVVAVMMVVVMMMLMMMCSLIVKNHYTFCTLSIRKNVQVKLNRTIGTNTHRAKLHRTTINKLQPIELICKNNPTS
jgi:cell division protein FtsX